MLSELTIKNIAIIDFLDIDFSKGFNVLTGETGAGKSIIVNSINLLLGERFDKTMLKEGEDFAEVSGIFSGINESSEKILASHDIDCNDEIIIRRKVNKNGHSKAYINDMPVTIAVLKEVGKYLIDLHGQHEHQSLFYPDRQREMLDKYGDYGDLIDKYQGLFNLIAEKKMKLSGMRKELSNILQNKDMYEFHLKEIDEISPKIGEDEELGKIEKFIKNRVQINSYIENIKSDLFAKDGVESKIWSAIENLDKLSKIDAKFSDMKEILTDVTYRIEDFKDRIGEYLLMDDEEFPPIDEIEARISEISRLKKKYGGTIESVLRYRDEVVQRLGSIDVDDADLTKMEKEIEKLLNDLHSIGEDLHNARMETIREIEKRVPGILAQLQMSGIKFKVKFEKLQTPEISGIYSYEFYIATNPGETPKPLNKIASGGEISRIMLAFKSLLNEKRMADTIVFDEIDTGIGGDTGYKIGELMKEIASNTQVITITHLPQVAVFANNHIKIEKYIENNRAAVLVKSLNEEDRIDETARMLGSAYGKESALEHAKELLKKVK